jgi:hypothetical protein
MLPVVFAVLLAAQGQDRPKVSAELDPATVRAGEVAVLRITIQSRGGEAPQIPVPVVPKELQMVGTQDYQETTITFGSRITTIRREIMLLPAQTGEFRIPPIRVTVGNTTVYTWPLTLRVTGSGVTPGSAIGGDARLLVRMMPDTVFVGQQSTLVGEVLLSPELQMRLTRPLGYDAPAPSDFWIQELASEPGTDFRTINGQRFVAQRFYRAYFPLTAGRYSFAPARVTYEARQGFLFAPQSFELRSESPNLTVLPLPEEGKPADFHGAVGHVSVRASIEPARAAVGDAVSLTVEVSGTGNIKALPPPTLPPIAGADVLDPSESADVETQGRSVGGKKRFTWVLVPERAGELEIPSITYPIFDPIERAYKLETTDPLGLDVAPAGAAVAERTVALRSAPSEVPLGFVRTRGFLALQLSPLAFLAMGLLVRRRRAGPPTRIRTEWQQRLVAARVQGVAGLTASEQLLRDALDHFSSARTLHSGSPAAVAAALQGVLPADVSTRITRLLEQLEALRYAPGGATLDQARAIFDELERILDLLWRALRDRLPAASALPVLLMVLQAGSPFQEGEAAFQSKRYGDAITAFTQQVRANPEDAAGWYNLGASYQANRQPAHAAWAMLHSMALEPRASGTRTQLARLGVNDLARRVRPLTTLSTNELLFACAAFWWFAALLLGYALARRRRWAAIAGGGLLALAGALFAVHMMERMLPPAAIVLDEGASLLAGRSLHSDAIRQLQPLAGVTVLEQSDEWLRVRTADGEEGWVSAELLGRFQGDNR